MRRVVVVLVVLVALVAGVAFWWERAGRLPLPVPREGCQVATEDTVRLDTEQMAHAATITAVGVRLGMPDRAVVVALATALQESKLRNLPHLGPRNDHDSIGLFQQRPSQGWGSEAEVGDPRYAAEQFYRALERVSGWQEMRITDAAQRVQRSAFPEAYQKWADDAGVLATALLGHADAAVSCTLPGDPPRRGTAAAEALGAALADDWGDDAAAVDRLEADPFGLAVSATDRATGWRFAHWLVAHAAGHGVTRVHFADLVWSAGEGDWGPAGAAVDHVLAEVAQGG